MPTAYDVNGQKLVEKLAKYLYENYKDKIEIPKWVYFIKTRPGNERNPDMLPDKDENENPGWFYYRMASILRYIYLKGPVGLSRLRKRYGNIVKHGMMPGRFKKGYGKLHRYILQQLESLGLVKKVLDGNKKGRVITDLGRSIIDKISTEIYREELKQNGKLVDQIEKLQ